MSQQKSKKTLVNWDLVTVNPSNKVWNWTDLFYFWGVNIQSVIGFSLITSLYVIYGLNTFVVLFGSILASILVYFFSNLIGKPSQKFGLPFVVLLRSSLGFRGAQYFGFLRSIVGKKADEAIRDLSFSEKRISKDIKKTLSSAVANAENNYQYDIDKLVVKEAFCGKQIIMKRFRARAKGRAAPIMKPYSNVTIILSEKKQELKQDGSKS